MTEENIDTQPTDGMGYISPDLADSVAFSLINESLKTGEVAFLPLH